MELRQAPKALTSCPRCVRVTTADSGALSDAQEHLCVISSETMGEGRSVALSYGTYMSPNVGGSFQHSRAVVLRSQQMAWPCLTLQAGEKNRYDYKQIRASALRERLTPGLTSLKPQTCVLCAVVREARDSAAQNLVLTHLIDGASLPLPPQDRDIKSTHLS